MPTMKQFSLLALLSSGLLLSLTACTIPDLHEGNTAGDTSISLSSEIGENPVPTVDICDTSPVPGIAFPRQEPVEVPREVMEAELMGDLIVSHGCLRIESRYGDGSILPVWPPEFKIDIDKGKVVVFDGVGEPIVREGQEVYMGGGEGSSAALAACVRQQLPDSCGGPYWVVGDGVRPNLRFDSEFFDLALITNEKRTALFLRKQPILDDWKEPPSIIAGKLILYNPNRCPRIQSESGMTDYVPIWPPDYSMKFEDNLLVVTHAPGDVAAQEGEEIVLHGGMIPKIWANERYRQLYYQLPGDCYGPYWIITD